MFILLKQTTNSIGPEKIFDFNENLRFQKTYWEKRTKRIIFEVIFQGHVYQCEHFEHILGAFRWFFAEQLRNFDFYESNYVFNFC